MDNSPEKEIEALKREVKARDAKRRMAVLQSAAAIVLISTIGLVISFSQFISLFENKIKKPDISPNVVVALQSDLQTLEGRLTKMAEQITSLTTPNHEISVSVEQQRLASSLEATDQRLKKLESAILESPERALSIPLLRKDIDESAKRVEEYRASSRADFDRLYEQQKWILGGIGTVLLAIIGGAVTIIFRSLPKIGKDEA